MVVHCATVVPIRVVGEVRLAVKAVVLSGALEAANSKHWENCLA